MHRVLTHRLGFRLMQTNLPKDPPTAPGVTLKRAFSQPATATALKQVSRTETGPSAAGDQRPPKVPKLWMDRPSSHSTSRSQPNNSDALSSSSVSSLKSVKRKRSRRDGQSPSLLKSRFKARYEALLPLEGPLRDADYIENQHRASIGSRSEIKSALTDNPKSPLMNFVHASFGPSHALQFDFKEYSDGSRPIMR